MEIVLFFWTITNLTFTAINLFIAFKNVKLTKKNHVIADNLQRDMTKTISVNNEIISGLKKAIAKPSFFQ